MCGNGRFWRAMCKGCELSNREMLMRLRSQLAKETVRSLPIREAILIEPYTVLRAAIAMMRTRSLGCAVVVKSGKIPCGMFTERSVLDVLAKGAQLDEQPVADFLDPSFLCVNIDDPILSVWKAVQEQGARFVCVTDSDGKAIGLTGQRGLSEYLADCFAKQIAVQRVGETPWVQDREGA